MSGRFVFNLCRNRATQATRSSTFTMPTTGTRNMSSMGHNASRTVQTEATTTTANSTTSSSRTTSSSSSSSSSSRTTSSSNRSTSGSATNQQIARAEQRSAYEAIFGSKVARQSISHFAKLSPLTGLAHLGGHFGLNYFTNDAKDDR